MTIKDTTYLNAAMTAKELSAKKIFLSTRPSTVLGELLDASVSFLSPKTTNTESALLRPIGIASPVILRTPEELASEVFFNTSTGREESVHSLKIAALAEDLAPYITAHISHTRNVVSPMVVDLAQKLEKFKEAAKPMDPAASFEIVKGKVPQILLDESFLSDGIGNYSNSEPSQYDFIEIDAGQTDEFISGLVRLGSDRLNELVQDWLKGKENDFIKNCFLVNFTVNSGGLNFDDYGLTATPRNSYRTLDVGLACYLIASRLFAEPQPVKGMSLIAYKSKLRNIIDCAGAITMKAAKTALRQQESGTLVAEAVLSKKRIVVNNIVYQNWLENGGSPEVLLGMLVSGQIQYAVPAINENRETLIRHWQNYLMLAQADVRGEMMKRFRSYLESEALLGLNDLTESEKDFATSCINLKDNITKKVQEEIDKMSHRLMDDVYHTALHVIAKARFYYTSAYQILNEMTQVSKQNPDIDVREAALLSVINYIAEYFVGQIEVTA